MTNASELYSEYREYRHWSKRVLRVLGCIFLYGVFGYFLSKITGQPFRPFRGPVLLHLDTPILMCSVFALLFASFWMIDAALLCAWFIGRLTETPVHYSPSTLKRFASDRSVGDESLVKEWIDVQLIADLTEPIGRLIYWPFIGVLLMIAARNFWWDRWTWHWPLLIIFALNLLLAAASSIILSRAANRARGRDLTQYKIKLARKKLKASPSVEEHESDQAAQIMEEINGLKRGAFAPPAESHLLGALLVNSSGLVFLQLLATFFAR